MGINKTIIFDIDETLVDNEVFPDNLDIILKEINKLKKQNYSFGICTNRPLEKFVKKIVDVYMIDDYIICEGGAIFYKKERGKYIEINNYVKKNINDFVKKKVEIFDKKNYYIFNEDRKTTSTIRVLDNSKIDYLVNYLKSFIELKDFDIEKSNSKILINSKNIDKIKTINDIYKDCSVIFVSDYERMLSVPNNNIKIYSVGKDTKFNKRCHAVFNKSTDGVLKILMKEGNKNE